MAKLPENEENDFIKEELSLEFFAHSENDSDELFEKGEEALIHKKYNDARRFFHFGEIIARVEKKQKQLGSFLRCLGNIYQRWGKLRPALLYYKEALEIFRAEEDETALISLLECVGSIYWRRNEYDFALKYYREAEKIARKHNDKKSLIHILKSIGSIYDYQYHLGYKYFWELKEIDDSLDDIKKDNEANQYSRDEIQKNIESIKSLLDELKEKDEQYKIFGASGHRYKSLPVISESDLRNREKKFGVTLPEDFRAFLLQVQNGGAGPNYGLIPLVMSDTTLYLCSEGCEFYTFIKLKGQNHGSIWTSGDLKSYFLKKSFFEWYIGWLKASLLVISRDDLVQQVKIGMKKKDLMAILGSNYHEYQYSPSSFRLTFPNTCGSFFFNIKNGHHVLKKISLNDFYSPSW